MYNICASSIVLSTSHVAVQFDFCVHVTLNVPVQHFAIVILLK